MNDLNQEAIALNKLVPWAGNVRRTGAEAGLDELTASIAAHGLLNPLTVRKASKGKYAVVAGQRRLKALQQLAQSGTLTKTASIACHVINVEANASELSLAENIVRIAMHPADQFTAWRDLVEQGSTITDIAARFGVAESTVRKRLALARVSPVIFEAYRDGELSLETLQAFTVCDDHALQERVWQSLSAWEKDSPSAIRSALTASEISCSDKRVRLVGLAAYEAAGGTVRRDLFDPKEGGWVQDTGLLDRLAQDKLQQAADAVQAEGWKWVEVRPALSWEERRSFTDMQPERLPLTDAEADEIQALEEAAEALDWESLDADEQSRNIQKQLDRIDESKLVWTDAIKAKAGVLVSLDPDGSIAIERGLIRAEDASGEVDDGEPDTVVPFATQEKGKPSLPASLVEELTATKTAALRIELARQPAMALALTVHAMVLSAFYHVPQGILKAGLTHRSLRPSLRNHDECKAVAALEAERTRILDRLPGDPGDLLAWCLTALQDDLLDALAVTAAHGLDAVVGKTDPNGRGAAEGAALAQALKLDMAGWYAPTAEGYFVRIGKAAILSDLAEARQAPGAPSWEKLKKADLAVLAERKVATTGWLPVLLR